MAGRILTCVYCGHEYPQDTPAHGSDVLTEHIRVCEKHPMRKTERDIAKLRSALKQANSQAAHFERLWYLTNEDAARYAYAKTLEGQVVTMETFKSRGAAELDQAIDDAMADDAER